MWFGLSFLFIIFIETSSAWAFFPGSCAHNKAYEALPPLVQKIAVVGDPDRLTEEDLATKERIPLKEVQRRYAATGILKCGKSWQTASVVAVNDVIVTNAHAFYKRDCSEKSRPEDCSFELKVAGSMVTIGVDKLVDMGYKCRDNQVSPTQVSPEQDWAVLRLKQEVKGVKAYSVELGAEGSVKEGNSVTVVHGISSDFYHTKNGVRIFPKAISKCNIREIQSRFDVQTRFFSDCDAGSGSSGAATLRDVKTESPIFLGIINANSENDIQESQATKGVSPNPTKAPYDRDNWATTHIPTQGSFLNAIVNASYWR